MGLHKMEINNSNKTKCIKLRVHRDVYFSYNDHTFYASFLWPRFWQCVYDLSIDLDPIHSEMLYFPLEGHQQGVMFEFLAIKRKRRKQKYGHSTIFY